MLDGGTPDPGVDWRQSLAGDDAEALTALGRYKTGADFLKTFNDAQNTIRSGQHKAPVEAPQLGEEPTDEEKTALATWRGENGIPEEAQGYLENLPDGMVLGEADEAQYASFAEAMHDGNESPESVHRALAWYQGQQEEAQAAQVQADKDNQAAASEELRQEWGPEFKPNLNSALNFLKSTTPVMEDGSSVSDMILGGRMADGTLIGDNPGFLKWLSGIAQEANPAGFIAPGSGLSNEQSITNEISEIEKLMQTDPPAYFADNAKQARLRTLYEARAKLAPAS